MFSSTRMNALEELILRPRPSPWSIFWKSPIVSLARYIYTRRKILPPRLRNAVTVVCVSDTHNSQPRLPDGDVLIHAGDLTQSGSFRELQAALDWIQAQSHPHKIVVAGNHDLLLDTKCDDRVGGKEAASERSALSWGDIIYLENSSTEIICQNGRKLNIYGSPKSCRHGNWAFQYPRSQGRDIWAGQVPEDTNILVTYGPHRAHLDLLNLGCPGLLAEVWRVRPALHVFGHVHEAHGKEYLAFDEAQKIFEGIVIARGGAWDLLRMIVATIWSLLWDHGEPQTLLVNPAVVGGLRDDERRSPVRVDI